MSFRNPWIFLRRLDLLQHSMITGVGLLVGLLGAGSLLSAQSVSITEYPLSTGPFHGALHPVRTARYGLSTKPAIVLIGSQPPGRSRPTQFRQRALAQWASQPARTARFGLRKFPLTRSGGSRRRVPSPSTLPTFSAGPASIVTGPDGALWFTENAADQIGRITTAGAVTEYPVTTPSSGPLVLAAGPDGALWFTENAANQIGRITTSGAVSEYAIPNILQHALWHYGGEGRRALVCGVRHGQDWQN